MRLSTADFFRTGIAQIERVQTKLAAVQRQLSSGKRILSASDDPGGAVHALELRARITQSDQYARNSAAATARLQHEEAALADMGTALQRVRELAVEAGNATQTDASRGSIARELREISAALLDSANARDPSGEYLFAGFRSSEPPFIENAAGRIEYVGDAGQRRVLLSADRGVAVGDSGLELMTVPRGNGVFRVAPDAGNTGTGHVTQAAVIDPTDVDAAAFTIVMTSATAYEVLDGGGTSIATGTYVAGAGIDIGGRRIVLDGSPAAGDRFDVGPAGTASIFAIVDDLATALETPRPSAADRAQLLQSTSTSLQDLDQALGRVLDLRTTVGARLSTIDDQAAIGDAQKVRLETELSGVEDLDYADAISRFELQQTALEAAQQTYVQLGRSSLFDFLR